MKIFGIDKTKSLVDFVSTEKDVQKGSNRMPLPLSRIYDGDIMSNDEVEKAKMEMKMLGMSIESPSAKMMADVDNFNQEDILANINHK